VCFQDVKRLHIDALFFEFNEFAGGYTKTFDWYYYLDPIGRVSVQAGVLQPLKLLSASIKQSF
jgi:hypothetical protein